MQPTTVSPRNDAIKSLLESDHRGKVQMINLLKFRARTPDGKMSGLESYIVYSQHTVKLIRAFGGDVIWSGTPLAGGVLVGDDDRDRWDMVVIVEYPSKEHFYNMVTSTEYLKNHHYREDALERTVLIPTSPKDRGPSQKQQKPVKL